MEFKEFFLPEVVAQWPFDYKPDRPNYWLGGGGEL
jgi:hypothetical protein